MLLLCMLCKKLAWLASHCSLNGIWMEEAIQERGANQRARGEVFTAKVPPFLPSTTELSAAAAARGAFASR